VLADASAYRDRVIAEAQGDVSRFLAILPEYAKAPAVTRERMYLDTMQDVLAASNKVIVDVKNGNNLMYLPLERMLTGTSTTANQAAPEIEDTQPADQRSAGSLRDVSRTRRSR
jgi:membrane protease subunit HflK